MFRRKRKGSDFNAEIEAHIEQENERLQEQGLSAEEARAAARRSFGNVMHAQENFYEAGRLAAGRAIWSSRTTQGTGLRRSCCSHIGAWYRRERRYFQPA